MSQKGQKPTPPNLFSPSPIHTPRHQSINKSTYKHSNRRHRLGISRRFSDAQVSLSQVMIVVINPMCSCHQSLPVYCCSLPLRRCLSDNAQDGVLRSYIKSVNLLRRTGLGTGKTCHQQKKKCGWVRTQTKRYTCLDTLCFLNHIFR